MDKNVWIGLLTAALCLAFVLTQSAGPSTVDTLEKETMQIHDEAMKEMADMKRLGRVLKEEFKMLDSTSLRKEPLRQTLAQMQAAEDEMYAWMQQYRAPDKKDAKAAQAYLEDQKQKIEKNQQNLHAALEAGKELQGQ
ncbi:MAG: hypothetical protein IT260_22075 [Saprospiraceae bacterium]|nr:hypothetical protein [Saprospiraceae bacterium]